MPHNIKDFPYPLRVGADIRSCNNLPVLFNEIDPKIDFLMVNNCHALNFRDQNTVESRDIALTRPDTCLKGSWW